MLNVVNKNLDTLINTIMGFTFSLLVLKDGTEETWLSAVYNNRYLRYVTESGDLDSTGVYFIQPNLAFPDGWSGLGETVSFIVYPKWR